MSLLTHLLAFLCSRRASQEVVPGWGAQSSWTFIRSCVALSALHASNRVNNFSWRWIVSGDPVIWLNIGVCSFGGGTDADRPLELSLQRLEEHEEWANVRTASQAF